MNKLDGSAAYTPCRTRKPPITLAPEVSVNIKKWIRWEAFIALPPTLQKVYMQTQIDTYRVGVRSVAAAGGKSEPKVRAVLSGLSLVFPRGTKDADKRAFATFVAEEIQ